MSWRLKQEYGDRSPPRAPEEEAPPSYKEEEYEDASPEAPVPVPEEAPPAQAEPAVVEPVGDLLVSWMVVVCVGFCVELLGTVEVCGVMRGLDERVLVAAGSETLWNVGSEVFGRI